MVDPRKPYADALRATGLNFNLPGVVAAFDALLDKAGVPRMSQAARAEPQPAGVADEPAWVRAGRAMLGLREIAGPKHNPTIIGFWQKLGAPWIKTDDADGAWCGGFMARCLSDAHLPWPKNYPAAKSFATWGTPCKPQVGAIGVKARKGGNHVFMIVGITADGRFYKALGGNQGNMVSIIDIAVDDVDAIRWPKGAAAPANRPLPVLPKGIVGASEA